MKAQKFNLDESVKNLTEGFSIDKQACDKLVRALPDEIIVTENYVSFDGTYLSGELDGNIQIIIKDSSRDSSRDLKLYRLVKSISGKDPSFKLDELANEKGLGYDLILRKRKDINFENVDEPEFQTKLYCAENEFPESLKLSFAEGLVDFVGVPAYVSITGSYIYHKPDRKPNDIDVVIKCDGAQSQLIENLSMIVKEKTGLDPHFVWEACGPNWTFLPIYDLVYRVRNEKTYVAKTHVVEAFHLRDTHWVPVPGSGSCPATHPNKLKFPGTDTLRCFTDSAAQIVRQRMREQVKKLDNDTVLLRSKDFPEGKCGNCRYFVGPNVCKIVVGPVTAEQVCNAFQGATEAVPPYEVRDQDWFAFVNGMVKDQPYQHIVLSGHLTPEGPIVIIKDTMKPKPHIFSLSKKFHIAHTTNEHHWTQDEVDKLIEVGKSSEQSMHEKKIGEQKRPALKTQSYILSKERFKTEAQARKWMEENNVPIKKIDETENTFRFRQFPPDRCEDGSFRPKEISDGVQILGCRLKAEFREQEIQLDEAVRRLFGSPGGKGRQLSKILPLIPKHKRYIEPFAGSADVFFAKELEESSILNDLDPNIYHTFKTIKSLSDADISRLQKFKMNGDKEYFLRIRQSAPPGRIARLHWFLYCRHFSVMGLSPTKKTGFFDHGTLENKIRLIPRVQERLKNSKITNLDAIELIRRYDTSDTFFFIDPPYAEEKARAKSLGQGQVDLDRLANSLKSLKGNFLLTIENNMGNRIRFGRFKQRIVEVPKQGGSVNPGEATRKELYVSNFSLR